MNQNWRYIFPKNSLSFDISRVRGATKFKQKSYQIQDNETTGTYRGLIAVNVINTCTMSEQRSKTTRRTLCCEKLGTMVLKALPLAQFWSALLLKQQMIISGKKKKKTLNQRKVDRFLLKSGQKNPVTCVAWRHGGAK